MVNPKTKQLYLNLFVDKLKRSGYIYKPELSSRSWLHTKRFLNDGLVYQFLEDESMIGQLMAGRDGNNWTDRIIIDLDAPEEQYIPMLEVMGRVGQEYPALLFRSSESGHLHAYYLLSNGIRGENVEVLQTYFNKVSKDKVIKRIEVYPKAGNGIRLPLGKGSKWLKTTSHEILTNDKNLAINEISSSWSELPRINRKDFIGKMYEIANETASMDELEGKNRRIIFVNKPAKLWTQEKQIREGGLTDYGQRNDAYLKLSVANVHRGLTMLESIDNITEWSLQTNNIGFSKDIQRAVKTGNFSQLEREMTSMYTKLKRSYNPTKVKGSGKINPVESLTTSELEQAEDIAMSLSGSIKRKHRQKKSEYERLLAAISFIWIQFQGYGWRSKQAEPVVRISKSLFDRAGIYRRAGRFDPIKRLIQAKLIDVHLKGYGNGKTKGRSTVYKLNFSLLNVDVSKNIKSIYSIPTSKGKEIKSIVKQCNNNGGEYILAKEKNGRSNRANTDTSLFNKPSLSDKILSVMEKLSKNGDLNLKSEIKKTKEVLNEHTNE